MLDKILRIIAIGLGAFAMGFGVWGILTSPFFEDALDLPGWAIAIPVALNAAFGATFSARLIKRNH